MSKFRPVKTPATIKIWVVFFVGFCFSGFQDTISNLLVKKMDAEAKEDYSIKTYWVCSSLVKPFIEELL